MIRFSCLLVFLSLVACSGDASSPSGSGASDDHADDTAQPPERIDDAVERALDRAGAPAASGDEAAPAASDDAPVEPDAPEGDTPADAEDEGDTPAAAARAATSTGPDRSMEVIGAQIRDAMNAANAAAHDEEDDCEAAYSSLQVLYARLRDMGPTAEPRPLPTRAQFVAACRTLSPELQRCMRLEYNVAHREDCAALQAELDPATRARLRDTMGIPSSGDGDDDEGDD